MIQFIKDSNWKWGILIGTITSISFYIGEEMEAFYFSLLPVGFLIIGALAHYRELKKMK